MTIVIVTSLFGVGLSARSHFPVQLVAQPAVGQTGIPRVTKNLAIIRIGGTLRHQQGRLMTGCVLSSGATTTRSAKIC
jgi:hypothetical protein